MSLGSGLSDLNDYFSHKIFLTAGGLNVVALNPSGEIASIAGAVPTIPVPKPSPCALPNVGLAAAGVSIRLR